MKVQSTQQSQTITALKTQPIVELKKNNFNIKQFITVQSWPRLNQIRLQLSKSSIKQSMIRVYSQKQFQLEHDLIQTQQLFDQKVYQNIDYQQYSSQYAQSSTLNKGKFSKNGDYYGTVGSSGQGYIWKSTYDQRNQKQFMKKVTSLKTQIKMCDIAFHPKIGNIPAFAPNICTSSANGELYFWTFDPNLPQQKSIKLKPHNDRINSISYHQSGSYFLCSSYDQSFSFYDCTRLQKIYTQKGHQRQIHCGVLHPDGGLYFSGDLAGCGMVWDLRTSKAVYEIKQADSILCCDFNPNGYELAVGGKSNLITIKDIRRLKTLKQIPAHTKLVSGLKYSSDQSILTSVSHDNHLKLWHGRSYIPINLQPLVHSSKLTSVDICDGKIATTMMERKWVMWLLKNQGIDKVQVVKRENISDVEEQEQQEQQEQRKQEQNDKKVYNNHNHKDDQDIY